MSPPAGTPKILGFISEGASAWRVALLGLLLGGCVTAALALAADGLARQQVRQRFELLASERTARIEERLLDQAQRVDSLGRFITWTDNLTEASFEGFARPLLARTRAFSWMPRVPAQERASFEAKAGFPIHAVDDQGAPLSLSQDVYFPIYYSAFVSGGTVPYGMDLNSQPTRRAALDSALARRGLAVSAPLTLVGIDPPYNRGVLIVSPVFQPPKPSAAEGAPRLRGFVSAIISLHELLGDGLPAPSEDNLFVRILDLSSDVNHEVLYASPGVPGDASLVISQPLRLADRGYRIELSPSRLFVASNRSAVGGIIATLGALLTLLLCALLYSLVTQRQRALQLVDQRTAELTESERRLRQTHLQLERLSTEVPGGIFQFRLNPDGSSVFDYASRGLWAIYEIEPEKLAHDGSQLYERIHPDDLEAFRASIQLSARQLTRWQEEYRVCLPSAGERWVRGEATPEPLAGGGVLWHGYLSDITDLKRVEQELRRLSVTDSLTGVYNRRYFEERLSNELLRADREHSSVAVVMLDIDHFKRINDRFGHPVGDKVLQAICRIIGQRLRRNDVLCRLGGEEFVVLCAGSTAEQAGQLARQLWQALRGESLDTVGTVTASFGVAGMAPGDSLETLLSRADAGVYLAKQNGRDQVVEQPRER